MLLKDHIPALKYGAKINASSLLGIHTTGNVYYVIKKTESFYDQFVSDYHTVYADGSDSICADEGTTTSVAATAALNTGIQDALDKCVSSRGDYVVVLPSTNDYDIGATLTMTKRNVHLISPQNIGYETGAMNGCRIDQVGAASEIINVSNSNIEIAGFWMKAISTYACIEFANSGTLSAWANSVHHNTFYWSGTTSLVVGSEGSTGDGGSYSLIANNWFIPAGSSNTTTNVVYLGNSAAAGRIVGNVCIVDNSNTLSNVYVANGAMSEVSNNRACAVAGGTTGTITRAVTCTRGLMSGNMLGVGASADVAPSGNTNGAVGNWSGGTGGAAASQAD